MKQKSYLLPLLIFVAVTTHGQLTGTKNIPGDYATLAAAITDLNTQGVGAGGVMINLLAANPQTAPLGGYGITASGTSTNTITITGNGNTITAGTPQTAGNLNDAIFKIIGGDYITIQGFTMLENPANTTTAAATNNMTEFGVALFYASTTNGAQSNTIQNNTITLNRTYQNTFGIYSNVRHNSTAVTTTADISSAAGANSNNKIYANTISNVNFGMVFVGSLTGDFMDSGLDIGGNGLSTGNTITDFGTTATFSGYVSVTATINGINVNNQTGCNISYNTIASSNGGVTAAGTIRGIYCQATGTLPATGSFNRTITHNDISIKGGAAANVLQGILHDNGTGAFSINISNNNFHDFGHTVAGTGAVTFINAGNGSAVQNASITFNTFTNVSVNTTGGVTFIDKNVTHPANAVLHIDNNSIVTAFAKTGSGGTVRCYIAGGSTPSGTETNSNNNFSNITVAGSTTLDLWLSQDVGTASSMGTDKTYNNNTFTNINTGSGTITALTATGSNTANGNSVSNNVINNVTTTGTRVIGILIQGGSPNVNVYGNLINGLSGAGSTSISGIQSAVTNNSVVNIYKNKIYDLTATSATGLVFGLNIVSIPTASHIYNNLIGDLKTPAANLVDAIRGINISIDNTANSTFEISYNSIYLNASSTGTNFGTSGIFQSGSLAIAGNSFLRLKNNIIVNNSTPNGTGLTVAFRRNAVSLNNYSTESNNNLFYAGTPGPAQLAYYDGTNADQTLAAYQTRVSPRDANDVTELPPFVSTTGSSPNFLHINSAVATQIESGGIPIPGITDDFDGNSRNASFPDIGADEFSGTATDAVGPVISYVPLLNTSSTANRTLVATITDASGIATGSAAPLIYYRKGTSGTYSSALATSIAGNDYTFVLDYTALGGAATGDIIQYYVAAQDVAGNASSVPFVPTPGINPPGTNPPVTPNQYHISPFYTWQGGTNDFQVAGNWSPSRTAPDPSDILVFDGSVTASATVNNIPTQTVTKVSFQNNVSATLNAAVVGNILTLSFGSGQNALDIQSGSVVNIGTTTDLNVANDAGISQQIGSISGTLNINGGSTFTTTSSVTTVSGTLAIKGNAATPVTSSKGSLVFLSGSTLQYEKDGGVVPAANYNSNSLINLQGAFTTTIDWPAATLGIAAGNLTFNSTGSSTQLFNQQTSIAGALVIQNTGAGSVQFNNGQTVSIGGNATINNGTWNIANATLNISGSLIENGGAITKTNTTAKNWTVAGFNQTAGTLTNTVAGLFTLTANAGDITAAGNVSGGASGGILLGFNGSAGNQTLTTAGATIAGIVGLMVNKPTGNLIIANDLTVNSGAAINFIAGKISLSAGKTLTIASGASITGSGSTSYVITESSGSNLSKLLYSGMTTNPVNFPIGSATNYLPAIVTPDNPGSDFSAGVFEGATQDGTPNGSPFSAATVSTIVNAVWQVNRTAGTTSATIVLNWVPTLEGTEFATLNNTQIGIHRYNGSSWDLATGTGDNVANNATSNFSSFSPFIVGKITLFALPVNLLSFSGQREGAINRLRWITSNETNSRGFEVQRSSDGTNYSTIGFVNSQATGGSSAHELSYTFTDGNPAGKKQYYRLVMTDIDGRTKTSSTILIQGEPSISIVIGGVYPNPASTAINIIVNSPDRQDMKVQVLDLAGRILRQQNATLGIGSNTIPMDIGRLAAGQYIIKLNCLTGDCQTITRRFTKQ